VILGNVSNRPCSDRHIKADPWPFDLSKIDTCEEAMFAPGADMIVKALVGEETPVRVRFSCDGQQMEYVQDGGGIQGQINGTPFAIQRIDLGNNAIYKGDTPAGPMEYTSTESPAKSRIKGLAGTVQYDHTLYPGEPGSGILSDMQGKFG
jgi:hypothetical protein